MEAGVKSTQEEEATTPVHDLHDAGKVVVEAAGTVAVDRLRTEVDARSSRAAVEDQDHRGRDACFQRQPPRAGQ